MSDKFDALAWLRKTYPDWVADVEPYEIELIELAHAAGRLEEFLHMKKERPLDPCYWDMHHERDLREQVEAKK